MYLGAPNPWDDPAAYLPGGTTEIGASGGTIAAWDYTKSLDVRIDMSMDTWVPPTSAQSLFFRYETGSSGTLSFWMRVGTDGRLVVTRDSRSLSSTGYRVIGGEPGERLTIRSYTRTENVFGTNRLVSSQYVGRDGLYSSRWESLGTRLYSVSTSGSAAGQPKVGATDLAPGMTDVRTYGVTVIYDGNTELGFGRLTGAPIDEGLTTIDDGYSTGTTWGTLSSATLLNANLVTIPRERIQLSSWSVGVPDILAGPAANSAKFVISDPERELDPNNASGPHYGSLKPRTRVELYNNDTTLTEWTGYVEEFVPEWREPADSTMTLNCGDALSLAADTPVRRDEVMDRVVELRPEVYLTFDQLLPDGTVVNDGVGSYPDAYAPNLRSQQTCIAFANSGGSISLDGSTVAYIGTAGTSIPPFSLMFWTNAKVTSDLQMVFRDAQLSPALNRIGVYFDTSGRLNIDDNNGTVGYYTTNSQLDGDPHFFFLRFNDTGSVKVYRDGVDQAMTAAGGGTFLAHQDEWYFGAQLDGTFPHTEPLDEFALFTYTVDAEDAAAIYTAATTARTPEEVLENICLSAGVPTYTVNFIGTPTSEPLRGGGHGGSTMLSCLSTLVAHEGGYCYVNESGTITLTPSDHRDSPSAPVLVITDEDVALNQYEYRADELVLAPNSIGNIINTVEVSWSGVTTTFQDKASVAKYGARRRQIQSTSTTYAAAQAAAQALLDRYAEPATWVTSAKINLSAQEQSTQDFLDYAVAGGRVTIRRQPLGTGSVLEQNYWIDQFRAAVAGPVMSVELVLSPF